MPSGSNNLKWIKTPSDVYSNCIEEIIEDPTCSNLFMMTHNEKYCGCINIEVGGEISEISDDFCDSN